MGKKDERQKKADEIILEIVRRNWPTAQHFQLALRQLEIFGKLHELPQFVSWMKKNIIIRDEMNDVEQLIDTLVIYTGGKKFDEQGNVVDADPEEPEQNIVKCPGCGVSFDSNVEHSGIVLADKLPD